MQNQNINLALKENSQILTLRKFAFKNHTQTTIYWYLLHLSR